ncbi:magnesium/cobalt transporter CorA [Paenibacillus thiaminolyticus]|uniref:Magnesium transport protein CorA n=1 Tax=Paenibacillus thiaminolyticus TaxID=49283 RepID=A0AAP9DTM3_PANTH|nr:magnesium/cobalt transporter CorA [Paenibacillus thiaminolyticus]MCY9537394.1 magnesium/cobalt transporter CorA [Paenibacillus thiaminolyticus]MCY9600961.1 magnesium/cobalt transporter CorA [Paenibacillus thiaminolyticus]MCY9609406.1 magnesium/cobalt transporter CorA [Paenibacillus thiaminolyticus]MCY9615088.1 magnesium/cobalt transporter CorA [Paenibacillus thiaminolyticus]MCY9617735.1 magnesium/cobalt transporter CorA [Paenibacillus thiaminolyticus]
MKIRLVNEGVFTPVDDIQMTLTPPESGFYWLDADLEDLVELQPLFSIHDLAVEDCMSEEEQRPKIEIYENHYFIVLNSIRFDDEEIFLRALNIFLGKHYIITVTKQKINELRMVKPMLWEQQVSAADRMLYHLIDILVDNYFSVADRIEAKIDTLEEELIVSAKKAHLNAIISLRSEILWLKKGLAPQKEVLIVLYRKDLRLIDDDLQKYFRDIYENAVKVSETFETFRDLMGNLRESYQLSIANRANDIMRVFTAITTIFMPLTLITGIYGMNFEFIPFMSWGYGSIYIIGFMLILGALMFYLFRKKDWI